MTAEHRDSEVAEAAPLTIGQLADYVGVTIRAIRHYHQRGLLAEPERDESGYRRYGPDAVLALIRIKTLAEAGVPLGRVQEVLAAEPAQLEEAVADLERGLQRQIRELQRRRQRIRGLAQGEEAFLPDELVTYLEQLRATGMSAHTIQSERDAWILLVARYQDQAIEWLEEKRALLAEPEFQQLTRRYEEAASWAPNDSRLKQFATAIVNYTNRRYGDRTVPRWETLDDPSVVALLASHCSSNASPALERLHALVLDEEAPSMSANESADSAR